MKAINGVVRDVMENLIHTIGLCHHNTDLPTKIDLSIWRDGTVTKQWSVTFIQLRDIQDIRYKGRENLKGEDWAAIPRIPIMDEIKLRVNQSI